MKVPLFFSLQTHRSKMDSVKRSAVTPSKSRLARTFAKVLHIRAVAGISSDDGIHEKTKSHEKLKKNQKKDASVPLYNDDDEERQKRAVKEAFLAKLFASLSSFKAAYAQLQFSQFPYDVEGIQSADQIIVLELKNLSKLKQSYLKKQWDESSLETSLLLSEIQEQKSVLKTYEITSKKLDSQLKLKDSEIIFLKEKFVEANGDNKSIEKRINSSGQFIKLENNELSSLRPSHFIAYTRQTIKSVRAFVRLLASEMEFANWDLDAAACSIEPGVSFWKKNHICFAIESFVCREMFDRFSYHNFSTHPESSSEQRKRPNINFDIFREMKSMRPADYLAWKPKSTFASFCRAKYLKLMHAKMEASLFGDLNMRNLVSSGEIPETPFFSAFTEMAKRVWLLHCLALSFDPEVSIYQVKKGSRFSEVLMESVNEEAFFLSDGTPETDPRVGFTVFPGFKIGKTVVQCHVYLC
ncbi:protein GRAVITROPIC IN THE LIGHT 1-like isoform X1 [Primulina eburnea]|uniref:protein GRAVITROPIC IN THE LIGHT 1-like isoform X1 n=2 Tax=Primulina eburnea TaxID=1245227 RepID=UPI003C6CB8DC